MQSLNEKGLYDIYTIWHIPFWQTRTFYIAVGTALCFLIILFLWLFIRWYLKKRMVPKTSWQRALEQLHSLQKKAYCTQDEGKHCYFAMTTILKTYFIDRFGYPLHGKTDEEMVDYFLQITDQQPLAQELKEVITGCLYIKFANEKAIQDIITQHLAQCCTIITHTIPEQASKNRQVSA